MKNGIILHNSGKNYSQGSAEDRGQISEDRKKIYYGVTRSITENIREWILLYKKYIDRINRIARIFFFLSFRKKLRKPHPPAAEKNNHHTRPNNHCYGS